MGVELYAAQQTLARLQSALDAARSKCASASERRARAEDDLRALQDWFESRGAESDDRRDAVDRYQSELDALHATLRQVEAHDEKMRSDIATTRTAAYAAEEAVGKLERAKLEQDALIDDLQATLKKRHLEAATLDAQTTSQRRETTVARETLAEANAEMEAVHHEKAQLASQWKSALVGASKREDALRATRDALDAQKEEATMLDAETRATRRGVKEQASKNEQLAGILRKVETECDFLEKNAAQCREKKERLAETHAKVSSALEETEAHLDAARRTSLRLDKETKIAEQEAARCNVEVRDQDERMLANLSEQTTVEKGVHKTAEATRETRRAIRAAEAETTNLQNDIAKTRVDALNVRARNAKLEETLAELNAELAEKGRAVEKYEIEISRRNDDVDKRAAEVERLNREYDRKTAGAGEDDSSGPMEATIKNMTREAETTEKESKELQRRWVGRQTELVGVVNENNELAEKTQRLKAERAILTRRRARLDQNYARQTEEIRALDRAMERAHKDTVRVNELSAKHAETERGLRTDVAVAEREIVGELRDLEVAATALESRVEAATEEKRVVLAEVVEAERQIMLWERKIQLEKETQAALDPDVGEDVVSAMRREISRMERRDAELTRRQEQLMKEMERSVYKRELIQTKAKLAKSREKDGGDGGKNRGSGSGSTAARGRAAKKEAMTTAGVKQACRQLEREIRRTESEAEASERRVAELESERAAASEETEATAAAVAELRAREEELAAAREGVERERERVALEAAKAARMLARFEEVAEGTRRTEMTEEEAYAAFDEATRRREKLARAVEDIRADAPHLERALERATLLLSA